MVIPQNIMSALSKTVIIFMLWPLSDKWHKLSLYFEKNIYYFVYIVYIKIKY